MAKTELEIIIDENGEVHLDVKGIKGKGCMNIAEIIEQIIGKIRDRNNKPEYYEENVVINEQINAENNKK